MSDDLPRRVGPYTLISSQMQYQNPWMRVREDKVIRPGGSAGLFGVVEMVGGSSVLAIDHDNVYLVREYKYAVGRDSLEVVSGAIDAGETPLDAARRELREEAGLVAAEWHELGTVDPFTTAVLSPTAADPDDGEEISLVRVPLEAALQMVLASEITHASSCILILRAARLFGR
jgi:ADP-ribose pyrophosphatase